MKKWVKRVDRRYLRSGVDVADIGGDTGSSGDIVEGAVLEGANLKVKYPGSIWAHTIGSKKFYTRQNRYQKRGR